MATVRKTISLTDQQDAWIDTQVQAGRLPNDSELIRREQERSAERECVRQTLIEGEQSGKPQPFDFDSFIQRKRAQYEKKLG